MPSCDDAAMYLIGKPVRWVSDDQPGWVEVSFEDAGGRTWVVCDKSPIFGGDPWDRATDRPREVHIDCSVVGEPQPHDEIVHILLDWGSESVEGASTFLVRRAALREDDQGP